MKKIIAITGASGFIGSHLIRLMVNKYSNYSFVNIDNLTYAGNLENNKDIESKDNYTFVKADIRNIDVLDNVFSKFKITDIIHLAAESHVDRSINSAEEFLMTNIIGTFKLLEIFRKNNLSEKNGLFYHISTDEVYGSLGEKGYFTESSPYDPKSPYSASKASSDHIVRAYGNTYMLPFIISNCSNNYGPFQFPEKLIPLIINNIIYKKPLPIYGNGLYMRDWLYVEDHAEAIDKIFHNGKIGETYNIGGGNEWTNLDLVKYICELMDVKLNREQGASEKLITFVKDRLGHDKRYAIDASKIKRELNWKPSHTFEKGINKTIDWYLKNKSWVESIFSGAYKKYC